MGQRARAKREINGNGHHGDMISLSCKKSMANEANGASYSPTSGQPPYPFSFEYRPSKWQRIRFFLMMIFVFPLRLVALVVCWLSAGFIAKIAVAFHPLDAKYRLALWRRSLKIPVIAILRLLFFSCGVYYVKVKGKRVSSKEAPIVCLTPHSSFIDVLTGIIAGLPVTVSTRNNAETPIVGALFRLTEAIFIDRACLNSREICGDEITRRAQTMGEWPQIMIFPEGCCTNRKSLLTFKKGAYVAGVPVQPLLIRYSNELDNATLVNCGPNQVTLFFVMMCTPSTNIEMEYLPVYYPNEEEENYPDIYAENVRQYIAKHLKVPTSSYTYKDLKELLDTTGRPNRSIYHFIHSLWHKGEVVMPLQVPDNLIKGS